MELDNFVPKDYFDELFKPKVGEKPKRFLADDGKWKCVSCYEEDAACKCAKGTEEKEVQH